MELLISADIKVNRCKEKVFLVASKSSGLLISAAICHNEARYSHFIDGGSK